MHEADQALGERRAQEFAQFDGLLFLLRCQQRCVRVSQRADGATGNAEALVRALWTLLAWVTEQVCDVLCAPASRTGAVRAAYGTPAKG